MRWHDERDLLSVLTTTTEGIAFLLLGNAIGAFLSLILFALTVVSIPLVLDHDIDFVTAMITSVRAVVANPAPMLGWGFTVGVLLVSAALCGFGRRIADPRSRHMAFVSQCRGSYSGIGVRCNGRHDVRATQQTTLAQALMVRADLERGMEAHTCPSSPPGRSGPRADYSDGFCEKGREGGTQCPRVCPPQFELPFGLRFG
jgi:Predicted integral membrane protein (DUF2189)